MQLTLITIAVVGVGYFALTRRRFDFFSLAFFSSCIYFLPGFAGFVMRPTEDFANPIGALLEEDTYVVMIAVLLSILLAGVFWTHGPTLKRRPGRIVWPEPQTVLWLAVVAGYFGFAMVLTLGRELLDPDKFELLKSLDRWHIVMTVFGTIAVVLAVLTQRWGALAATAPLFLLDLFIGIRATTALAGMAVAVALLGAAPPSRFVLAHKKVAVAALAVGFFFFSWQQFFDPLKRGDFDRIASRARDPGTFLQALVNSEPFTTQAILNEVIARQYTVPVSHLGDAGAVLIPFYTIVFPPPVSFNDLFQPDLFPRIHLSGLANNFWAQAMATGGYPLFGVFLGAYLFGLAVASRGLSSGEIHIRALAAIAGSYFAFYVHRNDALFQAVLERRILAGYIGLVVVAMVLRGDLRLRARASEAS